MNKGEKMTHSNYYGPIVHGRLLTHGDQRSEVVEDRSRGVFPNRQSTRKGLYFGSPQNAWRRGRSVFKGYIKACELRGGREVP